VAAKVRKRVATLSMRQAAWQLKSFCDTYCQTVRAHHDIEDFRIFPAVVAIAPEAGPVVEYLTADHVELGRLLDDLSCAVGALPGAAAAWAGAEDAGRELAEHLTAHLDLEEEHVLPPLVRLPDWI
jgi:hemerythrin-like domain-containing protein